MKVQIVAVGKLKAGPEQQLYDRYSERFSLSGRNIGLDGPFLSEIPESRQSEAQARKSQEATQLLSRIEPGSVLVALDEHGKDISSVDFSQMITRFQEEGNRSLAFAIGGADGHGQELLQQADRKLRLGSVTWPHQIVRILLMEQLYRANTIRLDHPYHRA